MGWRYLLAQHVLLSLCARSWAGGGSICMSFAFPMISYQYIASKRLPSFNAKLTERVLRDCRHAYSFRLLALRAAPRCTTKLNSTALISLTSFVAQASDRPRQPAIGCVS